MIGRTISHYEIIEQIGEGGMGSVYKALDTKLKVHRALKFIHPHLVADADFKHRFIQEAQAASSLDHPNICGIHQVDETANGRPFIVMTYYEGMTLSERLKEAPLPAVEIFRTGISIAQGLKCAHDNGIIHRDIKPGNILITDDGYIKILDFGLAKLAGIAGVTKTGVTLGTVRYMAPELGAGKDADNRSDIWSLGLIMYELATGDFPFKGDFDPAVIYSIFNTEPTPAHQVNPDIPESHSRVISHCLDKDPDDRYQSAAELINDMVGAAQNEGWGSSFGDLVLPVPTSGFGSIPARRRAWRRGLVGAVVVVAAFAAIFWWSSRPPSVYTTDLRVAVMPLKNKAHPDHETINYGLWEVLFHVLDDASRRHDSMWVVPNRLVRYAEIGEDSQAQRLFGVNRIITGGLQRFEGGQVLQLVLKEAETLDALATVRVPYDPQTTALADSLPGALAKLFDLDPVLMRTTPYLPSDGPAAHHYLRGVGYLLDQNYENALAAFGATTTETPVFSMGWTGLGQAQWLAHSSSEEEGLGVEAIETLERAVGLAPGSWRPLFELGDVHRKVGNHQEALAALFGAAELSPDNPRIVGILGRVLRYEERHLKAEELFRSVITAHPDYFEAQRQLATFHYWIEEEESALKGFENVLALAPDDAFSLNTLGAIYQNRGEFAQALGYFEKAYALLPNHITCSNIGLMLFHEEKYRESASFYELSLEWPDEVDAMTWANWAKALYWVEGGRQQSIPKFEKAIEMTWEDWKESPGDPVLLGDLIDLHAMIGDRETALRLIAVADSMGPDNGQLMFQIGAAYELLDDREAALLYLGGAIRHGIPVAEIFSTPELKKLTNDSRFVRMISAEAGQIQSQADTAQ